MNDERIGEIASEILEDEEGDYIETWIAVGEAMEICPTHLRSAEICADDRAQCEAGQGKDGFTTMNWICNLAETLSDEDLEAVLDELGALRNNRIDDAG